MGNFSKQFKNLAAGLAVVLFLCTVFLSAHAHKASQGEQDHSCSICQISHSNTKSVSAGSQILPVELKPVSRLQFSDPILHSTDKILTASIRGPPPFPFIASL